MGYGVVAVLAALEYRDATGRGQHIDLAQYETGLQYIAPLLLDYTVNGHIADARRQPPSRGRRPTARFACAGEDQLVRAERGVRRAVARVVPGHGPARTGADATSTPRPSAGAKRADELEARIGEWTRQFEARELLEKLQAAGVPVGHDQRHGTGSTTTRSSCTGASGPAWTIAEIGTMSYQRAPFTLSESDSGPDRPDPLLGEHNAYFYRELLGLSDEPSSKGSRKRGSSTSAGIPLPLLPQDKPASNSARKR